MSNKLTLLLMLLQFYAFTQNCNLSENYDNTNGWVIQDLDVTGTPVSVAQRRMTIANGTLNYIQSPDGLNLTRAYKSLGYVLCNSWQTEFIFNPTEVNSDQLSAGHIIFAATAGSQAPLRIASSTSSNGLDITDQDALGVFFRSNGSQYNLEIVPFIKNGITWGLGNCSIPLDGQSSLNEDVSYRIRLERITELKGRLTVFKVVEGVEDEELGVCCIDIPQGIERLSVIQHANATGGNLTRSISGTIDDLCIKNCFKRESCCIDNEIIGKDIICSGEMEFNDTYSVINNEDATYTWILPSGINFRGQGTSSISITDWGNYVGEIEIKVIIECGCDSTELSKTVTILNDLSIYGSFDLNTSTSSSSVASCTVIPRVTSPTDVIHWWNVYEAENCDPNDFSILNESTTGAIALRNPQTTPTAQFNSPEQGWANLETGKCYVIVHRVNYENEECRWIERRALISVSTQRSGAPQIVLISEETKKIENPSLGFKVYPNPSDLFVRLEQLGDEKIEKVQVFGINGIQKRVAIKGEQINISNLKQGVYLIKLHTNRGIYTQQFIKK